MLINNMINVINEPTRVTDLTSSLLDPVVVSNSVKILNAEVIETPRDITNHFATLVHVQFSYDS